MSFQKLNQITFRTGRRGYRRARYKISSQMDFRTSKIEKWAKN